MDDFEFEEDIDFGEDGVNDDKEVLVGDIKVADIETLNQLDNNELVQYLIKHANPEQMLECLGSQNDIAKSPEGKQALRELEKQLEGGKEDEDDFNLDEDEEDIELPQEDDINIEEEDINVEPIISPRKRSPKIKKQRSSPKKTSPKKRSSPKVRRKTAGKSYRTWKKDLADIGYKSIKKKFKKPTINDFRSLIRDKYRDKPSDTELKKFFKELKEDARGGDDEEEEDVSRRVRERSPRKKKHSPLSPKRRSPSPRRHSPGGAVGGGARVNPYMKMSSDRLMNEHDQILNALQGLKSVGIPIPPELRQKINDIEEAMNDKDLGLEFNLKFGQSILGLQNMPSRFPSSYQEPSLADIKRNYRFSKRRSNKKMGIKKIESWDSNPWDADDESDIINRSKRVRGRSTKKLKRKTSTRRIKAPRVRRGRDRSVRRKFLNLI